MRVGSGEEPQVSEVGAPLVKSNHSSRLNSVFEVDVAAEVERVKVFDANGGEHAVICRVARRSRRAKVEVASSAVRPDAVRNDPISARMTYCASVPTILQGDDVSTRPVR